MRCQSVVCSLELITSRLLGLCLGRGMQRRCHGPDREQCPVGCLESLVTDPEITELLSSDTPKCIAQLMEVPFVQRNVNDTRAFIVGLTLTSTAVRLTGRQIILFCPVPIGIFGE